MDEQMVKVIEKKVMKIRNEISELNNQLEMLITENEVALKNKLKGDQFVAFLGEYYASKILGADIEDDENSNFDLTLGTTKIEVKTRTLSKKSDKNNSWMETSTLSLKKDSSDPKFVCFVLLNSDDFSLNTIWMLNIQELRRDGRIKGNSKKSYLRISLLKDFKKMIYPYRWIEDNWCYNGTKNDRCIYTTKKSKIYQELNSSSKCS